MISEFKQIDNLSPSDFELYVNEVLTTAGWTDSVITEVGKEYKHGDGGIDIIAYKNKRKFAIEVKQRSSGTNVDIKALNQLVTGAKLANIANLILVTNSYFTSEVKTRSLRLGVELVDRDGLQDLWIKKHSEIGRAIKPRKYQETVIQECLKYFNEGKNKFLIEMATGLGKTYTAAHFIKHIIQNKSTHVRVLYLTHQIEILLQNVTAFKNVFGLGDYSFSACFEGADPENTDFVFGSFDTFFTKIDSLSKETFDIILVDEAHHVPARTYAKVVEHFHPELLIGLTATPYRADNKDVLAFFGGSDGHIGKYDLTWGLKHNKLAFPKYVVLLDDLDQTRIDQLSQGLSISDLDKQLFLHKKDDEVIRIIEETIKKKQIENPKGIVFCRNINHIKHLIHFFPEGSATLVHSRMNNQERRQHIREFREGNFRYILVCDIFNEGVDIPETNILVFLRYTASHTIWLQQLGRGLRKTPNKDYVHVLDFVGSLGRINDVRQFIQKVNATVIDKEDWEPPTKKDKNIVHDSTLEVTYNKTAAQVLKLIEDLKYRLTSRTKAINILSDYWNANEEIPHLKELEQKLEGVTYDQIATHFDSYFGYLQAAISSEIDKDKFRLICLQYAEDFYEKHQICPSFRAISMANQYNRLLICTEKEVMELIGDAKQLSMYLTNKYPNLNTVQEEPDNIKELINDRNDQEADLLIKKYRNSIKKPNDLRKLSEIERDKIKRIFHSEFYFLKLLQETKETK